MKRLIAIAAFAAAVACGADYPLNRVSSVRDSRPVGITEDEANALIREYDRTNLTERIDAKQNALTAGDHVRIEDDIISLDLESGPAPDYGTVSNRAMNARQLTDNVSLVTEYAELGPWDLHVFDESDPLGAPHSCRVRELSGRYFWVVYKKNDTNPNWWWAEETYASRQEAEQAYRFTIASSSLAGLVVSRPTGNPRSVSNETFVTQSFVTNAVTAATNGVTSAFGSYVGDRMGAVSNFTVSAVSAVSNLTVSGLASTSNALAASVGATSNFTVSAVSAVSNLTVSGIASVSGSVGTAARAGTNYTDSAVAAALGRSVTSNAYGSVAVGTGSSVPGYNTSIAIGLSCTASGGGAMALGNRAVADRNNTFVWNGNATPGDYQAQGSGGAFCVNPYGGADGFYIGTENLTDIIRSVVSNLAASGRLLVSTNGTDAVDSGRWKVIFY